MGAGTWKRLAVSALIATLAAGLTGVAAAPARAAAPFGGSTIQVNSDATLQGQFETTIAINPTNPQNLVAGSISYETGNGQCAAYHSTDRGQTWSHQVLPNPAGFAFAGDPVVAFDATGTAYFLCMNLNSQNQLHTQYVFRSTNGGQGWGTPVIAIGAPLANSDDKGHIALDDRPGSPYLGNVYVANTRLNTGEIRFARSTTGGASFVPDQAINDADIGFPAHVAVGADGAVYVSWARELPSASGDTVAIMIDKSIDGGVTFGALSGGTDHTIRANGVVDGGELRTYPQRGNGWPVIETHPTDPNVVYAVWAEDAAGIDDSDVMFSRSADGGNSWSAPTRVNTDVNPAGEFFSQFWPTLAVDPTDGEIDVIWYSDQNDPNRTDGTPLADLYFRSSTNAGLSFGPATRLTTASTTFAPTAFLGDYIGIDALGGVAHPIWADTTLGGEGDMDAATTQIGAADLRITKTDAADPAIAGRPLVYTLTATNDGPADAFDVEVVDTLPAATTHLADTGTCSEAPVGTLTCDLGEIRAGSSKTFTISVGVAADLVYASGGSVTITNTATASSARGDPVASNNADSESTQIVAEADLVILSYAIDGPVPWLVLGDTTPVTLLKQVRNAGPSGPTDVLAMATAGAGGVGTVIPGSLALTEPGVDLGDVATIEEGFTLGCTGPGSATFSFTNQVSPSSPATTDPDPSDNTATTTLAVQCTVPVAINVKPGSLTNPINLGSAGLVPVAILTTGVGEYGLPMAFDATTVDPSSLRFGPLAVLAAGGGAAEADGRGEARDSLELDEKTRDKDRDLIVHFGVQGSGLAMGDNEVCLTGQFTVAGVSYAFLGCDAVSMVP